MSNTSPTAPSGATPEPQQDNQKQPPPFHGTHPVYHYTALGVAGLGLLALALPPRTWGFRSTLLSSSVFISSNQLAHDYTGRSFVQRWGERTEKLEAAINSGDSDETRRIKEAIRAEKLRRREALPEEERRRLEALDRARDKSKSSWFREWDEKEKQALADGRGYGGLIMDTVREAFGVDEEKPAAGDANKAKEGADKKPDGTK
ncbi:hypothetical protein PspLS_09576 [Pyricularia sp. CBS 133598]|nr:hypothetical protein PspLS_09576 [Pyricularia sp. CBS 133598]